MRPSICRRRKCLELYGQLLIRCHYLLGKTAATLGITLGAGTMPKTPSELRGLGVPKNQLNPYTSQLSRWAGRTGIRDLRELGRTVGGKALGVAATGDAPPV